jgi:hypothetical protein
VFSQELETNANPLKRLPKTPTKLQRKQASDPLSIIIKPVCKQSIVSDHQNNQQIAKEDTKELQIIQGTQM